MNKRLAIILSALAVVAGFPGGPAAAMSSLYPEPFAYGFFDSGHEIAVADFNGDGKPDIAAVGSDLDSYGVAVYLSKGGGRYAAPAFYSTAVGNAVPGVIAIGDLNRDGHPDIVLGNDDSFDGDQVSVILNNGNGTFGAVTDYSPDTNSSFFAYSIAVGDATGDGNADVLVGSSQGLIYVVPGLGDGTLDVNDTQILTPSRQNVTINSVAVTDLDGDGNPDVLAAYGPLDVFAGEGGGTISPTPTQTVQTILTPTISVTDVNDDGAPDVVVGSELGNSVQVLLNDNGILTDSGTTYMLPTFSALLWVRTADIDGDGNTDILVSGYDSDRAGVLYGNGDGTFQQPVRIPMGAPVEDIAATDTDGDGRVDLISLLNEYNLATIVVARNLGNREFLNYDDYSYQGQNGQGYFANDIASADFDHDGKPDVATADSASVSVLLNNGNGGFQAPNILTASGGYAIATGDTNNDGKADIVVAGNHLVTYPGNGDGTFSTAIIGPYIGAFDYGLALGDVDGDGNLDAVVSEAGVGNDQVLVCKGDGSGQFDCGTFSPISIPYPDKVALVDINNDGKLDLISTSSFCASLNSGCAYVYLGNGQGSFSNSPSAALALPGSKSGIAVGDVNGDNNQDIVAASDDEIVSVFTGAGNGTFSNGAYYGIGFGLSSSTAEAFVALADVNCDGKQDIIAPNYSDSSVSVLINQGDGTFSAPFNYAASISVLPVLALDANGDGLPDIITATNGLAGNTIVSVYLHTAQEVGNQTPVAKNGDVTTAADENVRGRLSASDSDGDYILFSIASPPSNGTIESLDYSTGTFDYTPYPHYSGTDSFSFRATDSEGNVSNLATETISVKAAGGGNGGGSGDGTGGGGTLGMLGIALLVFPLLWRCRH